MKRISSYIFLLIFLVSCVTSPKGTFSDQVTNDTPDYSKEENWAALPWREDYANKTPNGLTENQENAAVDVFYLYPTTYFGEKEYTRWNAPLKDKEINDFVDEYVVRNQATAFNKAGKIYAPRYRQAHYQAYFHKDTTSAAKAFDLAYEDVKNAFGYYMSHWNKGRPFILASHSQGTPHMARLIEEFVDDKPLQKRMIAAYLLGIPVDLDRYSSLKACNSAEDVNCLIGWRTWKNGAKPKLLKKEEGRNVLITNPLNWTQDTSFVESNQHKGSVLLDFYGDPKANSQTAQIYKSILWTNKPKYKGSIFYTTKNYHRGDVNLFYMDIRENAMDRVNVFTGNK